MGKIISIDEINRAVMEGKDDLVFELCKVFDHESYFDPIFDPPESFLQECEAYWSRRSPFWKNAASIGKQRSLLSAKPLSVRSGTHGM